jgi:hypothetical protein
MSVHGIHNGVARPPAVLGGTGDVRAGGELAPAEPQRPAWPVAEVHSPHAAVPQPAAAQAPPGMDPALWSVLTAEERAFVGRLGARGPLTYGRMTEPMQPHAAGTRGGRLDVRA